MEGQDDYTTHIDLRLLNAIPHVQRAARDIVESEEAAEVTAAFAAGVDAALSWLDGEQDASIFESDTLIEAARRL